MSQPKKTDLKLDVSNTKDKRYEINTLLTDTKEPELPAVEKPTICSKSKQFNTQCIISVAVTVVFGALGLWWYVSLFKGLSVPPEDGPQTQPQNPTLPNEDDKTVYFKGTWGNRHKKLISLENNAEDSIFISSHLDLHGIRNSIQTVKILELKSRTIPSGIKQGQAIKHLELLGPISQPWLQYLIQSLNSIETIEINVDLVCSGFTNNKDNDNSSSNSSGTRESKVLTLPNLEKLTVDSSNNCPILEWGFDLNAPKLKTVKVNKSSLTGPYYEIFSQILNRTSESIEGIEISESYICPECDITNLQFENLKYLKITGRVEKIPFWRIGQ